MIVKMLQCPNVKIKKRAFTIIELLVVIAIFGLLVSIVVVSFQSTREGARIANLLAYSATIKKSLGDVLEGEWGFNEGSGVFVGDSSGNGNRGRWQNGVRWEKSIPELGWAGMFRETDGNYVKIVSVGGWRGLDIKKEITIEAWIKLVTPSSWGDIFEKRNLFSTDFSLQISDADRCPLFILGGVGQRDFHSQNCGTDTLAVNRWHHFVGTYNGSKVTIFVDAEELESWLASGEIRNDGTFAYIGRNVGPDSAEIYIDEVRIYSRGLTMAEIQKHYAQGAKKRGFLIKE